MNIGNECQDVTSDHRVSFNVYTLPRIENMGIFRTNELWAHMDRIINSDVLIFVREGVVHIIEDGHEYYIHAGQVFFMKNGVRHYGHKKTLPGSEWYWITFMPAKLEACEEVEFDQYVQGSSLQTTELLPEKAVIRMKWAVVDDYQRMCVRLNKLMNHYESRTTLDTLKLQIGVLDLLIDLYREISERSTSVNKLTHTVQKFVQQHIYTNIRSDDLTRSLQMNYSYISRVFSQETGISIQRYIMEQKVKEAIKLFSETALNVSQISEKLGYTNAYYFTRVFKQVTGYSPTSFLKRGYYDYSSKG
ncbi:AraC family transcriptional regulator [Paenibacillus ferrarius]|uniref:AraC family transcriptional regulator n=1 Tax=Paenibacillus ferrarius TaxID=1469647 RepID=UPI003D2DE1B5